MAKPAVRLLGFLRRNQEYYKYTVSPVGSQYQVLVTSSSSAPQRVCFATEAEAEQYWAEQEEILRSQGWWSDDDPNL